MQPSVQQQRDPEVSTRLPAVVAPRERLLPQVYVPPRKTAPQGAFLLTLFCLFALSCVLLGGAWVDTGASTSIVLIPKKQSSPVAFSKMVPTRLVQATSPTQQETVATTGVVQQNASASHGILTLYNTATVAITLAAGTTLSTPTGVSLVFDTPVTIPKVNYAQAVTGIATVWAHSDPVGSQGNLPAYTLKDVACCEHEGNIFASMRTPFRGGRDAVQYHTVASSDVVQAENMVEGGLTTTTKAALLAQLAPGEKLSSIQMSCRTTVQPDHAIGSKADQVTVTVQVTCQGKTYVYTPKQAQDEATRFAQNHPAFPAPFLLTSVTLTSIQEQSMLLQGSVLLRVTGREQWVYQWSPTRLRALAHTVAGMSTDQARYFLSHQDGVGTVSSLQQSFLGGDTLPTDANQITITVSPFS